MLGNTFIMFLLLTSALTPDHTPIGGPGMDIVIESYERFYCKPYWLWINVIPLYVCFHNNTSAMYRSFLDIETMRFIMNNAAVDTTIQIAK